MAEITAYYGRPYYSRGVNLLDSYEQDVNSQHGRASQVISDRDSNGNEQLTWEAISTEDYNWCNYNLFVCNDVGPEKKVVPQVRDMSKAASLNSTAGVRDAAPLQMASDEYPTKCSLISGGYLSRIATINFNAPLYLCDADNPSTKYHMGDPWITCAHDGDTPIKESMCDWKTFAGTTLRGKKLMISLGNVAFHSGKTKIKVVTATIPFAVTVKSNGHGTIIFDDRTSTSRSLSRGETTQFFVTADSGYKISSVTCSCGNQCVSYVSYTDTNAIYQFTMPTPAVAVTITATFEYNVFAVTTGTNVGNAATITESTTANVGNTVAITTNPVNNEYKCTEWIVKKGQENLSYTKVNSNTIQFVMPPSDVTVTAIYLKHAITWENASISLTQVQQHLTITYKGVATDNFGKTMSYFIYRDNTSCVTLEGNSIPNGTEKSVEIILGEEDEGKGIQFSLVAVSTPVTSKGATAYINAGAINRTVKYRVKDDNDKRHKWIECVPYFCPGFIHSESVNNVPVYDHYLRISYAGTYTIPFAPVSDAGCTYNIRNLTDSYLDIHFKKNGNTIDMPSAIDIGAGMTFSELDFDTLELDFEGNGYIEIESSFYNSGAVRPDTIVNKPIWKEVECYYYSGANGWQLCSFR